MAADEHHHHHHRRQQKQKDEDPEEDDDNHQNTEPAHHARRPMNAFLIFCKRHRAAVRDGFPNLENRAVTRVLGEWWAMLSGEQKRAYKNLAQEYKDAFLNANPDFKWYKLPAPPLRTLSTRPNNKKSSSDAETTKTSCSRAYVNTNDTLITKIIIDNDEDYAVCDDDDDDDDDDDEENVLLTDTTNRSSIQPGKLADETQIGGLSSLFTPEKTGSNRIVGVVASSSTTTNREKDMPKPPKKRCAELTVLSGSKDICRTDLFGDKGDTVGRMETNNNENNINEHRAAANDDVAETYIDDGNEDDISFRSVGRTCKGQRYRKFLAERTIVQSKQRRIAGYPSYDQHRRERRNSMSSNVSEKTDSLSSEGTSSRGDLEHLVEGAEGNMEASKPEDTETEVAEGHVSWTSRKRFKAEDFNLDKKIEALPSLSLEEFQAMKKQQRTKKKKITPKTGGTSSKRAHRDNSPEENSRQKDTTEKSTLVGSQKRKARKNSITRNTVPIDSSSFNVDQEPKAWCSSPDLEALACLAAVAANRTKLTKS